MTELSASWRRFSETMRDESTSTYADNGIANCFNLVPYISYMVGEKMRRIVFRVKQVVFESQCMK